MGYTFAYKFWSLSKYAKEHIDYIITETDKGNTNCDYV